MKRACRTLWGAFLLVACAVGTARAQSEATPDLSPEVLEQLRLGPSPKEPSDPLPSPPSTALAGPVDPNTYVVGPGDVLHLQLWGRVSRNLTLTVGPEGYLLVPGSGSLNAVGKTLANLRSEVLTRLRQQFRGVSMDFRLARPRTFRIYLTGQVRSPGPIDATGANRVHDVLAPGVMLENSSRRRIDVQHADGSSDVADLDLFLRTGDASLNPWLRDGDVINVPVATEFIWVQGAVAKSGRIELGPSDSLLTLFKLAGDPIPSADANRALLIRWRQPFVAESLWFTLDQVYERSVNPALREGDRLYVYFIPQYHQQHETSITGEIARPGVYPIVEGRHRLSDVVAAAGGFLRTADLAAIRVFHTDSRGETDPEFDRLIKLSRNDMTDTEYEILRAKLAERRADFRVDWNRLQRTPELDILLQDGDLVRVDQLITSVRVEGEVRRPGIIEYGPRRSVREYVTLAGGYSERAARSKVRVTRAVTGQSLRARDVQAVEPGDLIWVPERTDVTVWQNLQALLTAAAQVATVVIAVRAVR